MTELNRALLTAPLTSVNGEVNWDVIEAKLEHISCVFDALWHQRNDNPTTHQQVQFLCGRFFDIWVMSSWHAFAHIGHERLFELLEMMASDRFASWDGESMQYFLSLPATFTIYRGGKGGVSALQKGSSWTACLDVAREFADRFGDGQGIVIQSTLNKGDIVLLNEWQEEVVPRRNINLQCTQIL